MRFLFRTRIPSARALCRDEVYTNAWIYRRDGGGGVKTTWRDEKKEKGKEKGAYRGISCARFYRGLPYRTETISLLTCIALTFRVVKLLGTRGEAPRFIPQERLSRARFTVERVRSKQPGSKAMFLLSRFSFWNWLWKVALDDGVETAYESLKRARQTGKTSFAYEGNYLRVDMYAVGKNQRTLYKRRYASSSILCAFLSICLFSSLLSFFSFSSPCLSLSLCFSLSFYLCLYLLLSLSLSECLCIMVILGAFTFALARPAQSARSFRRVIL